eukprot:5949063-Pleurochrysis_carterae.AAC.1
MKKCGFRGWGGESRPGINLAGASQKEGDDRAASCSAVHISKPRLQQHHDQPQLINRSLFACVDRSS